MLVKLFKVLFEFNLDCAHKDKVIRDRFYKVESDFLLIFVLYLATIHVPIEQETRVEQPHLFYP